MLVGSSHVSPLPLYWDLYFGCLPRTCDFTRYLRYRAVSYIAFSSLPSLPSPQGFADRAEVTEGGKGSPLIRRSSSTVEENGALGSFTRTVILFAIVRVQFFIQPRVQASLSLVARGDLKTPGRCAMDGRIDSRRERERERDIFLSRLRKAISACSENKRVLRAPIIPALVSGGPDRSTCASSLRLRISCYHRRFSINLRASDSRFWNSNPRLVPRWKAMKNGR